MGSQQSRPRSPSTVSQTNTYYPSQQSSSWHHPGEESSYQNPYQREYPLPVLMPSDGRVKVRKNSSPSTTSHTNSKPARARFKPLRAFSTFRFDHTPVFSSPPRHTSCTTNDAVSSSAQQQEASNMTAGGTTTLSTAVHPLAVNEEPTTGQTSSFNSDDNANSDQYVWIAGRKYNLVPASSYMLPCDEDEVSRLHLLHFMVRFAIQGNYLAPVSEVLRKGAKVLDMGCGPGAWSMEIASEYPKSQVVGVDISPMFPNDIKPSNCTFHQLDLHQGLPFEDGTFDYVFMRFISMGIKAEQWESALTELTRVLKPGGWIELTEVDAELYRVGPNTRELNQQLIQVMQMLHIDPYAGRTLKSKLEKINCLTDIQSTFISCPGGQWAGKLGQLALQSWQAYYHALGPKICRSVNMPFKEYEDKMESCWREADEYKTFENVHFAYAQKKAAPA
ncbi:hypothetical protein LRAMOSA04618 [Lichtheimia ramosa]|uniref:Methyltransferase domain-containing protein n=1 Tax=Lichtheimia ramosa TaxID=688394 RepID=A0A077WYW2_9FUNG|nr:hypothetical protein LRAMOSA04618 [Lichtheimia ramosa]